MKMGDSNKEFDFQSILETCELHGESTKTALDEKNQSESSYRNVLDKVKHLRREWEEKNKIMFDVSLKQKRHLQKLEETMNRQAIVNKEVSSLHLEIASLNSDLQKQSDVSAKKTAEMNENLQNLYTHFDDQVLETVIAEISKELFASQEIEIHLQNELKNFYKIRSESTNSYVKSGISKILENKIRENMVVGNLDDIKKEIAEERKNIQFLTNQLER